MSDNPVSEINNDADKIEIDIDKIDVDKIDVDKNDVDKNDADKIGIDEIDTFDDEPHNGKPITMMEISPHEKYLITYSKKDRSIVGWNVEDQLKFHQTVKTNEDNKDEKYEIKSLCVSDDKILAYNTCIINRYDSCQYKYTITVIDMNNKDKNITLNLDITKTSNKPELINFFSRTFRTFLAMANTANMAKTSINSDHHIKDFYCTFNLKGEFILYSEFCVHTIFGYHKIIWIYSTQTKNNKWECKRFYRIPEDYELISISEYDKVYLVSNDYIYEWNINTERVVKIFGNNKDKNKFETKNIGIFSNEKFIFLKINDKIIVYSIELRIPIATLDINDDIQLYNFMNHTGLFLLPSLFYYTPDKEIKYCWNSKYKNRFNWHNPLFDEQTDNQTKFAFGILNGRVWKSKFDKEMTKTNFSSENSGESNKVNNKIVEYDDFKYLNVHSFNPYMDIMSALFDVNPYMDSVTALFDDRNKKQIKLLTGNLINWSIRVNNGKINLEVLNKHSTTIGSRIENYPYYHYKTYNYSNNYKDHKLIASSLFNNNDIVMLTTFGILIYTFSENNKSITLNYFYVMKFTKDYHDFTGRMNVKKILQRYKKIFSKSTLPLPNYDSFRLDGWVSDVINNKSSLLKYGGELLKFAIKEHKLELIDDIYKKCMTHFKEDLMNNKSFLSIITPAMPLLDKYYPEYILKYSSETNMIIDSSFYSKSIEQQNENLHLYSFFQSRQIANLSKSLLWTKFYYKINCIKDNDNYLLFLIPIIQCLIIVSTLPLYFATYYILSKYNFINDIYVSADMFSIYYFYTGLYFKIFKENITTPPMITFMIPYINFVNYSKDYNWFLELIRPQSSPFTETVNRNIYKTLNGEALINFKWNAYGKYYYAMIWILFIALLGCFTTAATIPQQYINDEVRQQLFIASIILGFIHLILEIRQFFYKITKWFKNFWNIFDIIAYVLSIYTSIYWLQTNDKNNNNFAHAFYILLSPKSEISLEQYNTNNNDDPNNPWNLAPSYNQIDNNGNINSNPLMIQIPDKNTNMFIDIRTSLFAIYLFLIGDSSALSNWPYTENPSIAVLIVLFSLLVVVYLMNLLIGLLNIAIEEDNNRVSYLMQKAETSSRQCYDIKVTKTLLAS
ncbi:unnamed protein product [Rhizophagus irregularis]|nr:unnamed protein product [Rhizophagus irregularis]